MPRASVNTDRFVVAGPLASWIIGALELVQTFLAARFSGADRHRRLPKVAELEGRETP
jgi:hypothetical protein